MARSSTVTPSRQGSYLSPCIPQGLSWDASPACPTSQAAIASKAFLEQREVGVVGEDAAAPAARDLTHNGRIESSQPVQGGGDRRQGQVRRLGGVGDGEERPPFERPVNTQGRAGHASELSNALAIRMEQGREPSGSVDGLGRRPLNALGEERDPRIPVLFHANALEEVVVT